MVKRNIPDWQRSAFDKDNNSCVKTKPFSKRIKEFEVANAAASAVQPVAIKLSIRIL